MIVKIPPVRAFPGVKVTKEQAIKPLEEATEVFAALGVDDLTEAMGELERKNERRGRYGDE